MSRPLRILVLDDNADNADALAELLEMEKHIVRVAYNGQDAIDAYNTAGFDLGLFDVMMPGKTGFESFLEIRSRRPDAKIYFMTGYSSRDLLSNALAAGAMGILNKPLDLPHVLNIVAREV
jgi:CheY-like chemotaxis protein